MIFPTALSSWDGVHYLQDVECPAELPVEMTAFRPSSALGERTDPTGRKDLAALVDVA